jgi:putative spermidine/putrescine transport system ATP-binding protein
MAIADRDFRELWLDRMDRNFGVVNALKGVTLTVRRGEFIALLGPSGCGKPTTLNCVAGLLTLSGGGIWLDKTRIDRLAVEERGFGMVFQNYALFPHMSVRRNIGFGLKMRGRVKTEITRKVDEVLKKFLPRCGRAAPNQPSSHARVCHDRSVATAALPSRRPGKSAIMSRKSPAR